MSVTIRYFAGARAACGVEEEDLDGTTIREVLQAATAAHPGDLERVIALSSYLVDGVSVTDLDTSLTHAKTLDILPPFAGG